MAGLIRQTPLVYYFGITAASSPQSALPSDHALKNTYDHSLCMRPVQGHHHPRGPAVCHCAIFVIVTLAFELFIHPAMPFNFSSKDLKYTNKHRPSNATYAIALLLLCLSQQVRRLVLVFELP